MVVPEEVFTLTIDQNHILLCHPSLIKFSVEGLLHMQQVFLLNMASRGATTQLAMSAQCVSGRVMMIDGGILI